MQNVGSTGSPQVDSTSSLQVGRAFSFMFEDKNWVVKIILGAVFNLLSIVLVGIPFILGYTFGVGKKF